MAGITGPTKFYLSPNPFTTKLSLVWEGISFNGYVLRRRAFYKWQSSTDGKNWGNWSQEKQVNDINEKQTLDVEVPNVPDGHYVQYRLEVDGINSSQKLGNNIVFAIGQKLAPSACVAPTSCSVSASVSEGNVTLSWSGAAAGNLNAISGYGVEYADSADNKSWGSWTSLSTVNSTSTSGSLSVAPNSTRGSYRKFRVRTLCSNTSFYSGFKESGAVRRNTLPAAPTSFTASPSQYTTEDVTLSWSGAAAGTSAIKQYVIQKAESSDNKTWGSWQNVSTITSAETSGKTVVTPTRTVDTYTLFRICTQDALNCVSAYKNSNSVYCLAKPFAPAINAPKDKASTYSKNPKLLIQTQAPPGGKAQTIFVKASDGNTYNSVDHAKMFSVSGTATKAIKTIFTNPDTKPGSFTASAHCKTVDTGPAVSRSFSVATSPFSGSITAGTPVKAAHIAALRTAINNVRSYYGLSAYSWAQTITAGKTNIAYWPYHIIELRAALKGVFDLLADYGGGQKIDWINLGRGRPRADVMNQLQTVILGL